jgi:hypothetical protein
MRAIRTNASRHRVVSHSSGLAAQLRDQPYFPRGVVSAHVRHGDKQVEMALQPWDKYIQAAEAMVQNAPHALNRVIFVSTEDDTVIQEATGPGRHGWTVIYTPMHRINGVASAVMIKQLGQGREASFTQLHLTQLLMALEADAWVGTRGSNWNRLIDELRCTWVPKCQNPYVEVGSAYENYNW